jgi:hypothetical protein
MFCPEFLNSLWQPPRNNPWPTHSTNQNYRMQSHKQCDYMLWFQAEKRISESFLLQNWLNNVFDAKDDEYKTSILTYKRELIS